MPTVHRVMEPRMGLFDYTVHMFFSLAFVTLHFQHTLLVILVGGMPKDIRSENVFFASNHPHKDCSCKTEILCFM